MSKALKDIQAERSRQINQEGWSQEHDDQYQFNELAIAAGLYALHAHDSSPAHFCSPPSSWPWNAEWWKPKSPREDLIRAAALIVAEIERIDRSSVSVGDVFQHVNSKSYMVLGLPIKNDVDPPEFQVYHACIEDGQTWVRSLENFTGLHETGVRRFVKVFNY